VHEDYPALGATVPRHHLTLLQEDIVGTHMKIFLWIAVGNPPLGGLYGWNGGVPKCSAEGATVVMVMSTGSPFLILSTASL